MEDSPRCRTPLLGLGASQVKNAFLFHEIRANHRTGLSLDTLFLQFVRQLQLPHCKMRRLGRIFLAQVAVFSIWQCERMREGLCFFFLPAPRPRT
jgi:hypothetical protein